MYLTISIYIQSKNNLQDDELHRSVMETITHYPFQMEYRMCTTPLSPYLVRYLKRHFPHIDYDPIRNMIVVVSSQDSYDRMQRLPISVWPKRMTFEEANDFTVANTFDLFYPCSTNIHLYENELESISELQSNEILGKMLYNTGEWYQIYQFDSYKNLYFSNNPIPPSPSSSSLWTKYTDRVQECYMYSWIVVWGIVYNVSQYSSNYLYK